MVAFALALNLATAASASACFIRPGPVAAGLLLACTALSVGLFALSVWIQRYPDWRALGPAGLSYIAAWALIATRHGELGTIALPDWLWQPPRLPYVGATSPAGLAVPVAGAMILLIIVSALRRVSITAVIVAWDILAMNLYFLVVSVLPQAGLQSAEGGWAGAVLLFLVALWQIAWLSLSRQQRLWRIAAALQATPAEAVELLSDLSRRAEWMPAVESDVLLAGKISELGATYLETLLSGHTRILAKLQISEKITANRVSIRCLCPYLLVEEYEVSQAPQGSQVSLAHLKEVSYPTALLGGVWWWGRLSSGRSREVANLRRLASLVKVTSALGS